MGAQEEQLEARPLPLIGWGLPWTSIKNLWGDSGFLEIWEPLNRMWQEHGVWSYLYLDRRYRGTEFPPPEESGIVPVFSSVRSQYPQYFAQAGMDGLWMQRIGAGVSKLPVDFVFTNSKLLPPQLLGLFTESGSCVGGPNERKGWVPILQDVLKVGRDTHDKVAPPLEYLEAVGYLSSTKVFFSTERERELSLGLVRQFFSDAEVRRFERHKAAVLPDGVSPMVQSVALSDHEARRRLCEPRREGEAKVAFVGRMNGNKNPRKIFQIMRRVYALDGVRLTVVSPTTATVPMQGEFPDIDVITELAKRVPKEAFLTEFLPSFDVILNTSKHEGYTVSVAEAVVLGVPVLLPDRPWARALVGEDYPFFYRSEAEAVAKIRSVRDGKVDVETAEAFLESRRRFADHGMDRCAERIYQHLLREVRMLDEVAQSRSHSRMLEHFQKVTDVGQAFSFDSLFRELARTFTMRYFGFNVDAMKVWKMFKPHLELVSLRADPRKLILRRTR